MASNDTERESAGLRLQRSERSQKAAFSIGIRIEGAYGYLCAEYPNNAGDTGCPKRAKTAVNPPQVGDCRPPAAALRPIGNPRRNQWAATLRKG